MICTHTGIPTVTAIDHRQAQAIALLDERPDSFLPEAEDLDQLLGGKITDKLETNLLEKAMWFDDILPAINWWRAVSDLALEGCNPTSGDFEWGPNRIF